MNKIKMFWLKLRLQLILEKELAKPVCDQSILTFDQARQLLGLQPFESFQHPYHPASERGTGRTTKMLLEAVLSSRFGTVIIFGHNLSYSRDLTFQARSMAVRLGLNPCQILIPNSRKDKADQIFVDHYRGS